jgi:hypothetical protein
MPRVLRAEALCFHLRAFLVLFRWAWAITLLLLVSLLGRRTESLRLNLWAFLVVLRRAWPITLLLLVSLLGRRAESLRLNLWSRAETAVLAAVALFVADVHLFPFDWFGEFAASSRSHATDFHGARVLRVSHKS